jgi:hypothetical protein
MGLLFGRARIAYDGSVHKAPWWNAFMVEASAGAINEMLTADTPTDKRTELNMCLMLMTFGSS